MKKSIIEVNYGCYEIYNGLRLKKKKICNSELGKYETFISREYHNNIRHNEILRYHLAIFYNIGDRKFVEKCHSSPVIKVWHPLG